MSKKLKLFHEALPLRMEYLVKELLKEEVLICEGKKKDIQIFAGTVGHQKQNFSNLSMVLYESIHELWTFSLEVFVLEEHLDGIISSLEKVQDFILKAHVKLNSQDYRFSDTAFTDIDALIGDLRSRRD